MYSFKLSSFILVTGIAGQRSLQIENVVTRTNFVASSKHFEKIINSPSNQLSALFIGLNESSHQELFNQSIFFEKFQIFQKLSWKN